MISQQNIDNFVDATTQLVNDASNQGFLEGVAFADGMYDQLLDKAFTNGRIDTLVELAKSFIDFSALFDTMNEPCLSSAMLAASNYILELIDEEVDR